MVYPDTIEKVRKRIMLLQWVVGMPFHAIISTTSLAIFGKAGIFLSLFISFGYIILVIVWEIRAEEQVRHKQKMFEKLANT